MNEFMKLWEEVQRGEDIYYHVTTQDFGPVVEFTPRRPQSACPGEPDDPRICVSPSLAGCLVAGTFGWNYVGTVNVYATHAKAKPVSSADVFDAEVTEEHWITEPAVFVKVYEIESIVDIASKGVKDLMFRVDMPYEDDDDESYYAHMEAKELVEREIADIEEEVHMRANSLLGKIIPRVKDIPGQGLFYFAQEELDSDNDNDKELEEAEDKNRKKIPSVPAPGNFHQAIPCVWDENDEE